LFSPESQEAIRNANLETEIRKKFQQQHIPKPDAGPALWTNWNWCDNFS